MLHQMTFELSFYKKYSAIAGGCNPKNSEVVEPYKHVRAFLNSAETMYIFPTGLIPIFRSFLKSMNLKYLIISPKTHSTDTRT